MHVGFCKESPHLLNRHPGWDSSQVAVVHAGLEGPHRGWLGQEVAGIREALGLAPFEEAEVGWDQPVDEVGQDFEEPALEFHHRGRDSTFACPIVRKRCL